MRRPSFPGECRPSPTNLGRRAGERKRQKKLRWADICGASPNQDRGAFAPCPRGRSALGQGPALPRPRPKVRCGSKADDRAPSETLQQCNTSITHPIRPALAAASPFPAWDRQGRSAPAELYGFPGFTRGDTPGYGKLTEVTAAWRRAWTLGHGSTVSGYSNTSQRSAKTRSTREYCGA